MKTTTAIFDSIFVQRLFDERSPRSDDTVERCTAEASARTRRLAWSTGLAFIVVVVFAIGAMFVAELTSGSSADPVSMAEIGMLVFVFGGAIPCFGVRWLILRDVKALRRLARDGIAFRPSDMAGRSHPSRQKVARLYWYEDGKEASADFELFRIKVEQFRPNDVCILARPHDKNVLVLLGGNGVFVGKRRVVLWGR